MNSPSPPAVMRPRRRCCGGSFIGRGAVSRKGKTCRPTQLAVKKKIATTGSASSTTPLRMPTKLLALIAATSR